MTTDQGQGLLFPSLNASRCARTPMPALTPRPVYGGPGHHLMGDQTMNTEESFDQFWAGLLTAEASRTEAAQALYVHLRNSALLSKVTLHRYQCRRGCQIATVFLAGGSVFCWVRDYKLSPGLNAEVSVESAREKNTIDGERHWPGHVHDVEKLARFSAGANRAGMDMNCRHRRGTVYADDILATVEGVAPGKPNKPTRL